jgi:hypothetical protein
MPTPLSDRTCRRYLPDDPPDDERRGGRGRWGQADKS